MYLRINMLKYSSKVHEFHMEIDRYYYYCIALFFTCTYHLVSHDQTSILVCKIWIWVWQSFIDKVVFVVKQSP